MGELSVVQALNSPESNMGSSKIFGWKNTLANVMVLTKLN